MKQKKIFLGIMVFSLFLSVGVSAMEENVESASDSRERLPAVRRRLIPPAMRPRTRPLIKQLIAVLQQARKAGLRNLADTNYLNYRDEEGGFRINYNTLCEVIRESDLAEEFDRFLGEQARASRYFRKAPLNTNPENILVTDEFWRVLLEKHENQLETRYIRYRSRISSEDEEGIFQWFLNNNPILMRDRV